MDMENITQQRGYYTVALCERSFGTEATGDFTLPDYQSDIRRILHVSQNVLPPSKYVGSDSVEFNGTLDYQVLYVGGDGGVYSVPLSTEYSFNVPLERGREVDVEDVCVLCNVCAESVNTRVSAPRRLSIRSRIRPNVRVYGKVPMVTEMGVGAAPESVYTRSESIRVLCAQSDTSDVINVSYSAPLPSDDIRVVMADADVNVTDVRAGESVLNCRGEVSLRLLCVGEESGEFSTLRADIPFEGEVDMEGVCEQSASRVVGHVAQLSVNVTDAGIECEAGVLLEAVCCTDSQLEYVSDAYSTQCESQCAQKTIDSRQLLCCQNAQFTLSERIPLKGVSVPQGAQIIDTTADVSIDKCTLEDGKYLFGGTASIGVLYRQGEEIGFADVNIPIRYTAQAENAQEPVSFDARARARDVRVKLTEDNLCVDAEISMCADCLGQSSAVAVDKVAFGESLPTRESELIVCYPSAQDCVWSVAKRYGVAPSDILGDPTSERYVIIE